MPGPMADQDDDKPQVSQIPLLNDIVYDNDLPLRPPPKPRKRRKKQDARPDYDPDTIDLFEDVVPPTDLRSEAEHLVSRVVDEYSREIISRLKEELTDQLHEILEDLAETDRKDPPQ